MTGTSAAAALLVLAMAGCGEGPPSPTPPTTPSVPSTSTAIDLGRPVCGECCTGKLWAALSSLPGIRDIDARPGRNVVTIYHEGQAAPGAILARVQGSGDASAAITNADAAAAPEKKWIRSAVPTRP